MQHPQQQERQKIEEKIKPQNRAKITVVCTAVVLRLRVGGRNHTSSRHARKSGRGALVLLGILHESHTKKTLHVEAGPENFREGVRTCMPGRDTVVHTHTHFHTKKEGGKGAARVNEIKHALPPCGWTCSIRYVHHLFSCSSPYLAHPNPCCPHTLSTHRT